MDERWVRVGKKVGHELLMMAFAFFGGMFVFVKLFLRLVRMVLGKHIAEHKGADGPNTPIRMSPWDK